MSNPVVGIVGIGDSFEFATVGSPMTYTVLDGVQSISFSGDKVATEKTTQIWELPGRGYVDLQHSGSGDLRCQVPVRARRCFTGCFGSDPSLWRCCEHEGPLRFFEQHVVYGHRRVYDSCVPAGQARDLGCQDQDHWAVDTRLIGLGSEELPHHFSGERIHRRVHLARLRVSY